MSRMRLSTFEPRIVCSERSSARNASCSTITSGAVWRLNGCFPSSIVQLQVILETFLHRVVDRPPKNIGRAMSDRGVQPLDERSAHFRGVPGVGGPMSLHDVSPAAGSGLADSRH